MSGAALSGAALSRSPQIVVIDASMALAWLFERQQAQDIEQANRLLGACGESPWWVPSIWHLEVANALLVAERRSVLPQAESDCFLAKLSNLPILTDTDPIPTRRPRILALARNHGLSSYDATYLERPNGLVPVSPASIASSIRRPAPTLSPCSRSCSPATRPPSPD